MHVQQQHEQLEMFKGRGMTRVSFLAALEMSALPFTYMVPHEHVRHFASA